MRTMSICGVPEHKRQESEELAALVAQFNQQTGGQLSDPVRAPAEPVEPAKLPTPIGPHSHLTNDERSIVTELRSIRAEARRLMARLPLQSQGAFE
jgi:hypothetical protein